MDKQYYTVILQPGTDEPAFLSSVAAGMTVKSNLNNFDGLILMSLTQDEVNILVADDRVIRCEIDLPIEPTEYPASSPVADREADLVTRTIPSPGGLPGARFSSTSFYYTGSADPDTVTQSSGEVGFFTNLSEDARVTANVRQNYSGAYVDVVAVEAGEPSSSYSGWLTHPDFMLGSDASRVLGEAQTYSLTLTPDGSTGWLVSGTDRSTTHTNALNPAINIYAGDTLELVNTAGSSHPLEIIDASTGAQYDNATGQGAYDGASQGDTLTWTPTSLQTSGTGGLGTYRCTVHGAMAGQLQVNYKRTRVERTDWSNYDNGLVDNDQLTGGADLFSSHAIGVLSACAGTFCGWSNASSLRVIYLESVADTYNAVIEFHKTKPVNPVTGVRNATIVTGAWGYTTTELTDAIPIDDIESITIYDADDNPTTINQGDNPYPQTFNITLDASGSSEYNVTGEDRAYKGAAANIPVANRSLTVKPGDTINITNNAHGSHPVEIRRSGIAVSGVTGAGTANLSWVATSGSGTSYVCTIHAAMTGGIVVSPMSTTDWFSDFTPFVNNGMWPRVIEDPADNTDKWCIVWGLNGVTSSRLRSTSLDTVNATMNTEGGMYHFKSAGNYSNVFSSVGTPSYKAEIRIKSGSTLIDLGRGLNGLTMIYDITSGSTLSSAVTRYPNGNYSEGDVNDFTIAASQHSTANPLLDDYSSRGSGIDLSGMGAYTYTCYPGTTFPDGQWAFFSGTSCAAPQAAGCASLFIDDYYTKRGVYPSIADLKSIMQANASPVLESENLVDEWWNTPSPTNFASTRLYSSSDVFRIPDAGTYNGGTDLSDLAGTPNLRVNVPYSVRLGTGKYIARGQTITEGRRPTSGRVFPRQKIKLEA
jgi:plastocyanin